MKRTQLLDARRNVRREIVAFVSIVIIGLLASQSYLAIIYSAATLKKDALRFFNDYGLWDLEVASTMLMDGEDLEAIRALPGVAEAESVWQIDGKLRLHDGDTAVSLISLPNNISRPKLLEGRLPETVGECAVEKELLESCGFSIGQRIRPETRPISGVMPLSEKSFVITGVFQTPDHITYMIPATPYILLTEDGFNREGLEGAFMKVRVRVEGTPENRYGAAYWNTIAPSEDAINAIAAERAELRVDKMRADIDARLDEGRKKLSDAREQLEDGRRQYEEGREELESKRAELEDGRAQLADARDQLEEGRAQLADARTQLDEGWKAIREAEPMLQSAKEQLDRGGNALADAEYQLNAVPIYLVEAISALSKVERATDTSFLPDRLRGMLQMYEDGRSAYSQGRMLWYYKGEEYLDAVTLYEKNLKQLEQGEEEYAKGEAALEENARKLRDGEAQLLEGEQAIRDGERKLRDAGAELIDGERQLRDGERELEDAEASRDSLAAGRWVVLNDRGNPGFIYARENANKLSSLSMSFSSIFLVVGALVIYATIGRMVEQHRTIIGATKAMGLYNSEVFAKYLFFACTATMLGVGAGTLLAWGPLQRAILQSYEKMLCYGEGTRSFLPLQTGLVIGGAFAISLAAVFLGCVQLLRLPAIQLMQGTMPAGSRRKNRRSAERGLFFRLVFRNMRTDWSRVIVTVVSVAGGCMLMVIGFTLQHGISGVPDRQFGGILTYEAEVFYDDSTNGNAAREIEAILEENALPFVGLRKASSVFEADNTLNALTLIVAEKGSLEGYFALKSLDGAETLELPNSGVLVPRRFWEHYSFDVGDRVPVYDTAMNRSELLIADVFENYYGQLFFLSPESYEEIFLASPKANCYFVKTDGMSLDTLREKLAGVEGVQKVNDAWAERHMIEQFTAALDFVVWLMLFIAGMMACFIVANFTMTFIQRKTRELTIMRINGYSARECIRYVAVDLIVTTVFGILLGLILGGRLGYAILKTTETPYIQMIRQSSVWSYLYSALITGGFSLLTNSYALSRIKKLKLSDIS